MNNSAEDVRNLKVQKELAAIWAGLDPAADIKVVVTIEDAINEARIVARRASVDESIVFIAGSLHLVGGALEILESGGDT